MWHFTYSYLKEFAYNSKEIEWVSKYCWYIFARWENLYWWSIVVLSNVETHQFQLQKYNIRFTIESPGGRLNKKDGLTRYGNSHVKDKTS